MEKCLICKMQTNNEVEGYNICVPCEDKYGNWKKIKEKLLSMDISSSLYADLTFTVDIKDDVKPFEASVSYSGGTKEDVIRMVCSIIDQEDITIEEIEENMY